MIPANISLFVKKPMLKIDYFDERHANTFPI